MIDLKSHKVDTSTKTRELSDFLKGTNNIYESVAILSKRANQISLEMKAELNEKLEEFATRTDNLEEIFENREQIEMAKHYEQMPKPTLISIYEFLNDLIYFRNPTRSSDSKQV